jgi:tetratricopeptide (TPR) repeat protein
MLRKEMTKVEIEKELNSQGDYVQIDNLTRFLKENLPVDLKKFVFLKLVDIYEKRTMFQAAADIYNKLTEITVVASDKNSYFVKEIQCYIKAGFFDKADLTIKKVVGEVSVAERAKIVNTIRAFYKTQAETYEKEGRRNKALQTYERMLTMNYSEIEKTEIDKKLLGLYKNLGMINQYMALEKKLNK